MPGQVADRNLLFGILALQMDFIERDALIAAMNAWVLEKDRAIGEILVEAGALDSADRDSLEVMIARRLARHGDDTAAGLAAISSAGPIAEDLRRSVDDPDLFRSIASIFSGPGSADPYATRPFDMPGAPSSAVRFRKLREHAAGNLGVVYVARDEELNREVALKEIKGRNADHSQSQAKFLLEAEVTGGLEHPGIVPVYGLGHYDDGRPFYAMRFIRGRSLLEAIRRFHADEALKSDPGARTLALQKLLRRFTDVCNAVAYAHSRGILHRDLKPDNVMVGKYGETLVVDWGLAKALGHSGEPSGTIQDPDDPLPEASLQPSSAESLEATMAGSLVGTPAYMSPEQAAGRLDLLGPSSDVYGLGATLYHLITGRPPILAATLVELLAKVQSGDLSRPRSHASWLDPALEAICLKAMALKPDSRYVSPRSLAEDLDRWIAGEPVAAYPEPFARRARRWAGKNRTSLATAGSAVTVAALLLGGAAWFRIAQREKTDASALGSLGQAERQAIEARSSGDLSRWDQAIAKALQAEDRLDSGGGSAAVRREVAARLESLRADRERRAVVLEAEARDRRMVEALDEARLRVASHPVGLDPSIKHDAYLAAFRAYGIDVAAMPVDEAARRVRSSPIADDLLSALDDWSLDTSTNVPLERLAEIAQAAEKDPRFLAGRAAFARQDAVELRRICREEFRNDFGQRFRSLFSALMWLDPEGSLPLLESIRREHPDDFWINHDLGTTYMKARPIRVPDAIVRLSVAAALRPGSSAARFNLGVALRAAGQSDDAIAAYREAIRLRPGNADAHAELGPLLTLSGETAAAILELREAIRLDPANASSHSLLGLALSETGAFREALEEVERGHAMGSKRPDWPDPSGKWVEEYRRLLDLDGKLSAVLKGKARPDGAEERLALADLCRRKGLRVAAVRFFAEAFAERPELAQDRRYAAACLAAQAGSMPGRDVPPPDEAARAALRLQALGWLRADLAAWAATTQGDDPKARGTVAATLARWETDARLAALRDRAALAALPGPDREAFNTLWLEVQALRKKAEGR